MASEQRAPQDPLLTAFKRSLADTEPDAQHAPALTALWWAGKGDWERAHRIVMDEESAEAAWVHAYLHRVEGDLPNARYWYRQAGRSECKQSLEAEWDAIAGTLLAQA